MRWLVFSNVFLSLAIVVAVGGCAYRPLYGKQDNGVEVVDALRSIEVVEQTTRVGQLVRNELITSFGGSAASGTLKLGLKITERQISVSTLPGSRVSRLRYEVKASYSLNRASDGELVTSGRSISAISYDTSLQPIADLQSAETARARAAREVALDIKLRLSAFLADAR